MAEFKPERPLIVRARSTSEPGRESLDLDGTGSGQKTPHDHRGTTGQRAGGILPACPGLFPERTTDGNQTHPNR